MFKGRTWYRFFQAVDLTEVLSSTKINSPGHKAPLHLYLPYRDALDRMNYHLYYPFVLLGSYHTYAIKGEAIFFLPVAPPTFPIETPRAWLGGLVDAFPTCEMTTLTTSYQVQV